MLAKHAAAHPEDWDKQIALVAMSKNSAVLESTGYTPFFLSHCRVMRLPIDLMIPTELPDMQYKSTTQYANDVITALQDTFQKANEYLHTARRFQQSGYDKWAKERSFSVGDKVWLYDPTIRKGRANKRILPWVGPYIVTRYDTDLGIGVTYRIQLEGGKRRLIVHYNRLKPCFSPPNSKGNSPKNRGRQTTQHVRSQPEPEPI